MKHIYFFLSILLVCTSCTQKKTPAREFLRGGDISSLTYLENSGVQFADAQGTVYPDVLDLLQAQGVNCVRLRLYNNPGTPVEYREGNDMYRFRTVISPEAGRPAGGYQGQEDILSLARRAKAHGMQICLTFHLSDFWSHAGLQLIPANWAHITDNEVLADSVYAFVSSFMQLMQAQNTLPEIVSIGNESNGGILFGYTYMDGDVYHPETAVPYGGHYSNEAGMRRLFGSAAKAIREVAPEAQIAIHLNGAHAQNMQAYKWLLPMINPADFDVIAGSYYPYWAHEQKAEDDTPATMGEWAKQIWEAFHKPVLIMETGYAWTQYRPAERYGGDYEGQLHLNGSYNEATPEGQRRFIEQMHSVIDADEHILGYLYWDPILVEQKHDGQWLPIGWVDDGNNDVGNTTWFDYEGKALPILDAIRLHDVQGSEQTLQHGYRHTELQG